MDIFMAKQMRVVCRLVLIQMLLLTISFPGFAEETESHFKVLEIKEQMYAGSPAVAVLLSQALDPTIRHDRHLRISDVRKMLKSVWVLSEDGHTLYYPHVKPESEYSVTVLPSLKSAQDQELGTRVSEVVKTRKMPAGVSFASNGFVLPSKLSDGLPVVTVNVEEVFIEFFRLHDQGLIDFVNWSSLSGKKSAYRLRQLGSKYGDLVYSGRFDLHAPDNRRVIRNIGVQDIDALSQPGVYVAVLRQPGQYEYQYSCAYFLVTDIGLQVRVYADEIMVIASSIKTGKPLQGVELSFVDKESRVVLKGTTDSQGLFAYTGTNIDSFRVLKVIASSQVGVLPLQTSALDLSGFDITGRDFQPREVFLYSPRDLYRPGEQMIISALFRDYDGRPLPDLPLHVSLIRPDNKELRSFSWHPRELNATGINYYQKTIHIPSTAQTGKWRVEVKGDPAASVSVGSYSFHVEEFVPERMKLQLTSPKDLLHGKGPWPIEARGTYLYGARADNNEIETRIFVRASRHPFPDLKDFEFGLEEEKHYSDTWKKNAKHLDKQGKADLSIENHWTNLKSPMAVHATVSLLESGGRPVKRTITRTFFPANELVGIRKLFEQDTLGPGPVGFEVVNVDRQGNFIPAENLVLDIIKQDREYFWEYSEEKGWTREYTEKNSVLRSETVQFDGQKPLNYTVRLERGRYLLRVKNLSTGQMTTTRFRVGFWWGGADETDGAHPEKVMLQLDQPAYQPGDRIELTVTPPHSGQALITVESDTTLWSRRTHVSDQGTVLEIPVSADWNRHDMYISAVVFRPCNAPEKIGPNRAVGVIHLPLQRSRRKLEVNIDAPDKVSPQDTLPVHIQVKGQGQKAFVTLAAVDVGVLNITDMKTPQPYAWFFTPRRYDVLWYDMYGKIIEMMEGEAATVTFGGDKDMRPGGKRPETKVEIVSLFKGPVELSEQGEARIDLHLPYFNGRLRLMAVAFSKNDYGSAHGQVQVTAPLVTQLSTPRFLAAGDSSQLTLDIHNLSGWEHMIELELMAEDPLCLEHGNRTLSLQDKDKATLRFPVTAGQAFGRSRIDLSLHSGDFHLQRDWHLGVRPGYPGVTRKKRSLLRASEPGQSFILGQDLSQDLMPSTLEAHLKISPTGALQLKPVLKDLISYPYGCLEQTTSRVFPLIYVQSSFFQELEGTRIEPEKRVEMLEAGISRIRSMQKPSGGFGQWSADAQEAPWLTVYATDFLLYAREQGLDVSQDMLQKALQRAELYLLHGVPETNQWADARHFEFAVRSYAAYVLSRLNRAPLGTLRTLFDHHQDEALSRLPLIHLGIALESMGDVPRGQKAVHMGLEMQSDTTARTWSVYGSALRDTALAVALLLEHGSRDTDPLQLAVELSDMLRTRRYLSTQEKFALFKAGVMLSRKAESEWEARLSIGNETKTITHKGPYVFEPSRQEIQEGIEVRAVGDDALFASAVVTGYTKAPPQKVASGMQIQRRLYNLEGQRLEKNAFHIGEMILVRLDVRAKEQVPDALVVDLIPAGMEIENLNLEHSINIQDISIDGNPIWRMMDQASLKHQEFRDDRYVCALTLHPDREYSLFYPLQVVSPGRFFVPPPMAESMYRPEIRAIGQTGEKIKVVNRPQ